MSDSRSVEFGLSKETIDEQPIEQIRTAHPEVPQRVMVHRHAPAQPSIAIMALAKPLQSARTADTLGAGIEPQGQQKPRRCRRVTGPVAARLDAVL